LGDNAAWEFVFLTNTQPALLKASSDEAKAVDEDEVPPVNQKILDVPPSWPSRLEIAQDRLELGSPNGVKTALYQNAKRETFAPYLRMDGMMSRTTIYQTVHTPFRIQELFENRKYVLWCGCDGVGIN
jgi:hypothetical protein